MGYKEKPYLKLYKVINGAFSFVAVIDDYQDFSTETKLYEAGNFTCTINLNIPNSNKFERGMFIWADGAFWEITTITDSIGSDGKGSQIRQITGYDARYILKRRIIRNMNAEGKYEFYAKGELCLRNLVYDQCGLGTVEKRRLPIVNTIPLAQDAVGEIYALSAGYENLYEVCKTIATQSGFGWRIDFDGTNLTLVCFSGEDKSNKVQFSTDMDSLADGTYTDTADSYANCIYVGGKGQNAEQEIYEGEQDGAEGLARYEAYDSKSDLTTENEYEAEALAMLTQYAQTVTLSGNGLAKCPYEFKKQYNVGDYITVSFSGHKAKVQILSVTQNWAWNSYSLSFEFGKPQNTLDEQLQLLLKKVQAGEKPRTTDSVFWYTIPTDTEQSKDEVKYNTIGFIGDCGADGSTFQLYLDNEKNGSKSYHIYFKELVGKTLTLTTGRAGAQDLTVSTGTYVLIVYVDENGNVNEQGTTATDVVTQGNTQPVTSDAVAIALEGSVGLPVGSVVAFAQGTTHENWLLCDGRDTTGTAEELQTHYPALYTYLGNSNVLPDYRECTLVGVGQNDTDTIADHDVYTLGQFKDDQLQNITGSLNLIHANPNASGSSGALTKSSQKDSWSKSGSGEKLSSVYNVTLDASRVARTGTTTHGKQKGVAFYIKATSAGPEVEPDIYATKGYIRDQNVLSDYEEISIPSGGLVVDYDGYVTVRTGASGTGSATVDFYINSQRLQLSRYGASWNSASYPLCKGDKIKHNSGTGLYCFRFYKLRDYTGR